MLLTLLCATLPMGAINGFGRYDTDRYVHSEGKGYWGFAIFIESMVYLVNLAISSFCMYKVLSFDPYVAQNRPSGGGGIEMTGAAPSQV
ncbi:unnamed protein product [Amoebophrya sp. A25]|nr:unnamed protein product [Amoebophrya sp. A25]|eukprot:GSA25T00026379001.1